MAHFHETVGRDNDEFELAAGDPVALKLFKTTLNEFKNRTDYINVLLQLPFVDPVLCC